MGKWWKSSRMSHRREALAPVGVAVVVSCEPATNHNMHSCPDKPRRKENAAGKKRTRQWDHPDDVLKKTPQ